MRVEVRKELSLENPNLKEISAADKIASETVTADKPTKGKPVGSAVCRVDRGCDIEEKGFTYQIHPFGGQAVLCGYSGRGINSQGIPAIRD